jgi:SAM-dependent MidA family methyltransferase
VAELTDILRAEIAARGAISFARFMAAALYEPGLGYYERTPGRIGRAGDFFTSVSVGPVFGELLAARFAPWLRSLDAPRPQFVEAGGHNGRLAADLLGALAAREPELAARLDYVLVEPSPTRRAWQRETLREQARRVRWIADLAELPAGGVHGVIFGNEFLDALPVYRLGWDAVAGEWFEWHVGWDGGRFHWARPTVAGQPAALDPALREALAAEYGILREPELRAALPDGFALEVRPAATAWWKLASRVLGSGWLVAIDYGFDAADAVRPERPGGTVRAYVRHHAADDVLAEPGSQDLTAHVNFAALIAAGERAGLRTEGLLSQAAFLVEALRGDTAAAQWTATERRQFQTLVHPLHLGERFKVLVQSRRPLQR